MTTLETLSTKDRILEAAERLFAEQGFAGTSLRSITADARVNLAAVHYHFGSKEGLIRAVFQECLAPLNEERLKRLASVLEKAGNAPPELEAVVEAFVGPTLRLYEAHRGRVFLPRLIGRAFVDADDMVHGILGPHFDKVRVPFMSALHRVLPDLPPEELQWRTLFLIGAMAHTMIADPSLLRRFGMGEGGFDTERVIRQLVSFVTAGLRAPKSSGPTEGKR